MRLGFSLIEMMVIVAIIAFLTFVAVPTYTEYVNNTKISQAVEVLNDLNASALHYYNENGGLNDTFFYNGEEYGASTTNLDYAPVAKVEYFGPGEIGAVNQWAFCVYVSGLDFPGYTEPSAGGSKARVCSKVEQTAGIFKNYCGRWPDDAKDIPATQLPAECRCASVNSGIC